MKPSDLNGVHPWNSITQNCESEQSMRWLVHQLELNGNEFRPVTFDEYQSWGGIRYEDGFNLLAPYIKSADTIVLFSKSYMDKYNSLTTKN